jgi:hypothetical protein
MERLVLDKLFFPVVVLKYIIFMVIILALSKEDGAMAL